MAWQWWCGVNRLFLTHINVCVVVFILLQGDPDGSKYQMYYFWRLGKPLDFSEMTISKILPIHLNHPIPLLPQKEASRSGDRLHKRRLKNFFGLSQNRRGQGSWNELLPSSRAALYICQKNGRKSPQKCNLRLVNGLFIIILTNFQNF